MKFYDITLFVCLTFFSCASQKEHNSLSKTISLEKGDISKVYYKSWVAGVQGGGSGINFFIAEDLILNPKEVYFRGKVAKLEHNGGYYIGRFISDANQPKDFIIDSSSEKEYKNKLPEKISFPFDLEDNEAVILTLNEGKNEFIKLVNVNRKAMIAYPSVKK